MGFLIYIFGMFIVLGLVIVANHYLKLITKKDFREAVADESLGVLLIIFAIALIIWPLSIVMGILCYVGYNVWKHFVPNE